MAQTQRERLAETLRSANVAAALLSDPGDVCYATGFEVPPPIDAGAAFAHGPALALVAQDGTTILLAPAAYELRANELSRADRTLLVAGFGHFEQVDGPGELLRALDAAFDEVGLGGSTAVALDNGSLPAGLRAHVADRGAGTASADARELARKARMIKTDPEFALLRQAARAADAGQEKLMEAAVGGSNELELMGEVLTAVDRAAGRPLPWAGELVSGSRTGVVRYPGGPVNRAVESGDTVLMDLSVRYLGYWADCTNTLVAEGEPSKEQLCYFRAARDAYDAAVAELRPGRCASDAHAAAADAFHRHGFEPAHYTGHQIGATVNEDPRLVPYDDTPIEAGMVFAVEPGCYGGLDVGTGARAERVVHVTEQGAEPLTRFRWGMDA